MFREPAQSSENTSLNLSAHLCGVDGAQYHIADIVARQKISFIVEGSSEVKLPTIWTDVKAEVGRVRQEKKTFEKIREEKEGEERRSTCAKR